jgi:hypothetical protein
VESTAARCARSAAGEAKEVGRRWGREEAMIGLQFSFSCEVNCLPI